MNPLKVAYKAPKKKLKASEKEDQAVKEMAKYLRAKWEARDLKKYQSKLNNQKP